MERKPKVFVVMPFTEDLLALYEEFKRVFGEQYEFTNAGDLDNQQNILQDIVEGIFTADIVLADLTGLNANVFYELGLAHAMNKKTIIITQDIGELPFDIKAYRANEYSLQFNKLPHLMDELRKLLDGAVNGQVKYGNPVSDFIPNYLSIEQACEKNNEPSVISDEADRISPTVESAGDFDGQGFIDFLANVEESSERLNDEILAMGKDVTELNLSVNNATAEINRVKGSSKSLNASFVRNVLRKLAEPIDAFAIKIRKHTIDISHQWSIVENNYLTMLDDEHAQTPENIEQIRTSITALKGLQNAIYTSNGQIDSFVTSLRTCMGMERQLSKALSILTVELEKYLSITDAMASSVDRIINKSNIVIAHSSIEK